MPATVVQMTRRTSAADAAHITDRKRKTGASPAPDSTPPKRGRLTPSSRPPSSQLKPISESSSKLNRAKSELAIGSTALEVANLKDDLKCSMEDNAGLTKTVEDLQAERNELRTANSELACKKTGAADEMDSIRQQVKEQQAENARLKAEQQKQQAELQAATAGLEAARVQAEQEASELRAALFAAREEAREQGDTLEEVTERSRAQEELRRKMHETIQDLKGNIRVFCRVRGGNGAATGVRCPPTTDSSVIELLPPDATGKRPASGGMMRYQFDRVFDEATSQADVFAEVSQLTQSALDGFKVCIFAYGQTGSGKTFTMDGPRNKGAEIRGVVPRAAEQAFARAEELRSLG